MPSQKTVPVSERALIQRINRALKDDGEMLKAARSSRVAEDIGEHFLIHLSRNVVLQKHVDVEALGRELGVLEAYEHVEDSK
jgi:hypothetical protein